ncbi:putative nuclease HARBI1 [Aphis craccivora]|uniref:Putative nuclease HARBI1 n=1 Tax=Aphis craccivora TaxID=307492 RepID=A0A6G0VTG0_APHCR|nr:putative nuclease HARBI1 [Aphis craccivora]
MDNLLKAQMILELLSSSSSSDDEMIQELISYKTKIPKIKNFLDNVKDYSDNEAARIDELQFKKHFRMNRSTTILIITHHFILNLIKQWSLLEFASNKCTLLDVASRFGLFLSSQFRINDRVMEFLIKIAPSIIKMPKSDAEKESVAKDFEMFALLHIITIALIPHALGYWIVSMAHQ